MKQRFRVKDIVARNCVDEFLIFLECKKSLEATMDRIYHSLLGTYKDFTVSFSMGIARTETVGLEYDKLFQAADHALYTVKRTGGGRYCFYDVSMQEGQSTYSQIEEVKKPGRYR